MKIAGIGTITSLTQNEDDGVDVDVEFKCKAEGAAQPAKDCSAVVTLNVKSLVAEKLSWGQRLYLTIGTDEPKSE